MSYQVLARKWRPATFEQMVGQSHVLHALTNALSQQRLHHAYLFSGTRGVGKTSLARLFAKGLNCEKGVTASPCGQCSSCVEIAEGRFVDLIEVDAASRTKVDDTRELLDNVQYRPSRGRFKVYLIDEVHMLSRSSFNALLKTLEEPPEHVKFLLATTDPQRLPVTVLSRCLQFNLKSLTQDEISAQLANVLGQEQLSFEQTALALLAKAANGSMRDALSLTDQAIAFGAGQVHLKQVQTMLGSIDEQHVISLLVALVEGKIENLMAVVSQVLSFGADPEEVLRSLLELLHQITLSQFAPAAAQLSIYSEQIKAFANQLSPEQVQLYYQLLLTGRKDLPHAPDPKSGLEMALLRAVSFVPETPVTRWVVDKPATITVPEVSKDSQSKTHLAQKQPVVIEQVAVQPVEAQSETITESAAYVAKAGSANADVNSEEDTDEDADDLLALNSEQALIISQASSQGMDHKEANEPEALTSEPQIFTAVTQTRVKPVEEVLASTNALSADTLPPELDHESTHAQSQTQSQSQTHSHEQRDVQTQPPSHELSNEQLAQDAAYEAQFAFEQGDEAVSEEYVPFDSLPAQQAPVEEILAPEARASEAIAPIDLAGSANQPVEDDILDAVLAARDSLLTDLATQPQESAGKKPEAEPKEFVAPKRKVIEPTVEQAVSESASSALVHDVKGDARTDDVDLNPEVEDRPPWEEPLESNTPQVLSVEAGSPELKTPQESQAESLSLTQRGRAEVTPVIIDDNLPPLGEGEVTGNEGDLKWYRLMSAIDVGGRVRQLAVNSVCHEFTEPLNLLLKPNQKHLAADIAIEQLEEALSRALDSERKVNISVGVDRLRETPLEIRQRFHREIQAQAHQGLLSDSNIQWLMSQMGAELEADSLSYAPELLSLKGNTIELIDKSNFKSLS